MSSLFVTGRRRPYVPKRFRYQIFTLLHALARPGVRATQRLVASNFVWLNINTDVRKWTRQCLQCQRNKTHRHTVAPLATFATPDARFDHVHVDIVGPLPTSNGYSYLLTGFTRWVEAIPLPDITADTVAQAFVTGWKPVLVCRLHSLQIEVASLSPPFFVSS